MFPCRASDVNLNSSELITASKIVGRAVHLLVDSRAGVSAIDEKFFNKNYGQFSPM